MIRKFLDKYYRAILAFGGIYILALGITLVHPTWGEQYDLFLGILFIALSTPLIVMGLDPILDLALDVLYRLLGIEEPTLEDANELLAQLPEEEQEKFLAMLEKWAERGDK